jgi:hypothetical protein
LAGFAAIIFLRMSVEESQRTQAQCMKEKKKRKEKRMMSVPWSELLETFPSK